MASSLQSSVEAIVQNDYTTLVVVTAVVYDYILTFPREVEYIWNRPWTFVSTLFVFVRYLSLCAFLSLPFVGGSFLPGPVKVCLAIETFSTWAVLGFICAADFMMILRLWAIYHRSKLILGILLCSYVAEVVPSTIANIIYSNPKNTPMTVTQTLNYSYCTLGFIPLGWNKASIITQLIHAVVMCGLLLVRFTWQSFQMYKATKQWRLDQFISLFMMEGLLYFLFMLCWNVINTLYAWGILAPTGWVVVLVGVVETVPIATMAPRFMLSLRELYARKVQRTRRSGIDTGFGLSSSSTYVASMVFADGWRNEELERDEEIPMDNV